MIVLHVVVNVPSSESRVGKDDHGSLFLQDLCDSGERAWPPADNEEHGCRRQFTLLLLLAQLVFQADPAQKAIK